MFHSEHMRSYWNHLRILANDEETFDPALAPRCDMALFSASWDERYLEMIPGGNRGWHGPVRHPGGPHLNEEQLDCPIGL